jgi:hypothetical protein
MLNIAVYCPACRRDIDNGQFVKVTNYSCSMGLVFDGCYHLSLITVSLCNVCQHPTNSDFHLSNKCAKLEVKNI